MMRKKVDQRPGGKFLVARVESGESVGSREVRQVSRALPGRDADPGASGLIHGDRRRPEGGSLRIGANRIDVGAASARAWDQDRVPRESTLE